MKNGILIALISIVSVFSALGQSTDELFKQGRELAFDGDRSKARMILKKALIKSPDYHDIRVFLARTYAWDAFYDSARIHLEKVLSSEPKNYEAHNVSLDVELWADNYEKALKKSEDALLHFPNDADILYKKAKAQEGNDDKKEARRTLDKLLQLHPGHKDGRAMAKRMRSEMSLFKVTLAYDYTNFTDVFDDPWHESSIAIGYRSPIGTMILRDNFTSKFGGTDNQFEFDIYPGLWKGAYAYLSIAWAPDTNLFPYLRTGGELYQSLPKAWEASLGWRYLSFSPKSDVTIITASLGKYIGNYWISLRTYLTPSTFILEEIDPSEPRQSLSRSLNLTVRRYYDTADDFIGFSIGSGLTPEVRNSEVVQINAGSDEIDVEYVDLLNSLKIKAAWQKRIGGKFVWLVDASYALEQRKYFDLNILAVGTALTYHF